ncbi:hypothetical protein I552_4907 [Mycobacterium xenopi 3993]|nr:hypothetical protein I552_4907 [Mycobacterium xenopi 3993]
MGVQIAQYGAHPVAAVVALVLPSQVHRDHRDQRGVGQRVLFDQVGRSAPADIASTTSLTVTRWRSSRD